jgi:anti-sigma-K factor RskA
VRTAVGAIAGVAAVLAVVFGVSLVRANDRVSTLEAAAGHPAPVAAALRTPGHQVVDLKSASNAELAEFVMVPDGQGYLVSSKLPTLAGDQTYQLWGIVGNLPISLGVLGHAPSQAAFTMAGSRRPSRLTITAEPAGGTVVPTGPVVATGTV